MGSGTRVKSNTTFSFNSMNEVAGRVDTHDLQGINLLGDAHRTDFRGDVRPHLSCQNQAHDGTGKLQEHDFTCGVAADPTRHPWTLDVKLHLDADDGTYEKGNK